MDTLSRIAARLLDLIRSMTPGSRLVAAGLLVTVVVSLVYLANHQNSVADVYLMDGEPFGIGQLNAMQGAFAKAGLSSYETDGGRVRVPRGQQPAYMAALADSGALPPTFGKYLEKTVSTTSPFTSRAQQAEAIKFAKQSELQLIISHMQGIESAAVLYDVSDKRSSFGPAEPPATASVSVKPIGTQPLDEERVPQLRYLVTSAIAGLKPENVTITDLNGRSYPGDTAKSGAGDAWAGRNKTYERECENKIVSQLSHISGLRVTVSAELDSGSPPTPRQVRAVIGVPTTYYDSILAKKYAGKEELTPRVKFTALAEIERELKAEIQGVAEALLPKGDSSAGALARVNVNSFQAIAPPVTAAPTSQDRAIAWAEQHASTLAVCGLSLVCLLVLRSVIRSAASFRPITADSIPSSMTTETAFIREHDPAWAHRGRERTTPDELLKDELAEMVDDDPDAAASVLRTWIGSPN